ncbi:MAG: hypothetical protein JNJ45_07630 [Chthonomonas sp.]|nr:hypothetical protein [Chthonomonas sp.]
MRSAAFGGAALIILWGCSAPPRELPAERVFVAFAAIERPVRVDGPPLGISPGSIAGEKGSIGALPGQSMYAPRALAEVRRAETALQAARVRGFDQLREEIERTFRTRAERQFESELGRLDDERDQINRDALAEIRDEFDRHAEARTPILYDLSKKAGYPAETRRSQRFQRTRELMFPKLDQEIEALRAELLKEDAIYLANRARILGRTKLEIEEAEQANQNRRQELLDRSQAQARAFLARALAESKSTSLDAGDLLEVNERIPPAAGASLNLPALRGTPPAVPAPLKATRLSMDELRDLAKIWAETRNYVLVNQRGGANDATIEFKTWLKTYQAGP